MKKLNKNIGKEKLAIDKFKHNSQKLKNIDNESFYQFNNLTIMVTKKTIDRFIKLRSEGLTFGKIASVLKVTDRTLRNWNKKYYAQIEEMVSLRQQDLMTELLVSRSDRLRFFADEFKKLRDEVSQSIPDFHYQNLLKVIFMLNKEIEKFDINSGKLCKDNNRNIDDIDKNDSENSDSPDKSG